MAHFRGIFLRLLGLLFDGSGQGNYHYINIFELCGASCALHVFFSIHLASDSGNSWRRLQAISATACTDIRNKILANILVCWEPSSDSVRQFVASTSVAWIEISPRIAYTEGWRRSGTGLDGLRLCWWFASSIDFAWSDWGFAIGVHQMLGNSCWHNWLSRRGVQ